MAITLSADVCIEALKVACDRDGKPNSFDIYQGVKFNGIDFIQVFQQQRSPSAWTAKAPDAPRPS
ncbi:putative transposase [Palleronia aestuarii]|uniref:Putative transposase n=1 Tax=Palleronia aestuarii TaxID=568105 RepID=A0A2W7MV09_9RHOB|nr:hypothetical protein [Palleronia aestuarii]PZX11431.1 putative transposase [Palleronia aestuarii]